MTDDMQIPERFEFHEWYREKHGEEYSFGYTEMYRRLAGREGEKEQLSVQSIVNQWMSSPDYKKPMSNIK